LLSRDLHGSKPCAESEETSFEKVGLQRIDDAFREEYPVPEEYKNPWSEDDFSVTDNSPPCVQEICDCFDVDCDTYIDTNSPWDQ
jgi:hypothetical protein